VGLVVTPAPRPGLRSWAPAGTDPSGKAAEQSRSFGALMSKAPDSFREEAAMHAVVGPVLTKDGGYSFESWTPEIGLSQSYAYRRVEDAHYARKAEIRSRKTGAPLVICGTVDEFASALAGQYLR
jgi:hypothetical protein